MAEALVDIVARTLSAKLSGAAIAALYPLAEALAGDVLAAIEDAGYAVVPKEPSEAMQEALFLGSYEDMLNAAPKVNPSP